MSMPLFHSNALMAGWGPALMAGAAVALPSAGRFSASGFLPDVRRHGATYFNYVGKPLSYILATPEQPDDADNPLVRVFGNEGRPTTSPASASASASRSSTATGPPRAAPRCSAPPTRHRAPWGGPRRERWWSTPTPARSAHRPASTTRGRLLNAEEAIGELVSSRWRRASRATGATTRPSGPACATGGTGPATSPIATKPASSTSPGATTTGCASTARTSRRRPWRGSSNATPTSCWPRSTPCPTPSWATRSWRRVQLRPGVDALDADGFAAFLAAQGDLGTKWAPRFVRVCPSCPSPPRPRCSCARCGPSGGTAPTPCGGSATRAVPYEVLSPEDAAALEETVGDRPL